MKRKPWLRWLLSCTLGIGMGLLPALANPGTGKLFGTDAGGENLHVIDPQTGAATLIGNMGIPAPGLAMDPTSGILYAGHGSGTAELYRVDPITAAATLIGDSGFGFASLPGLDFDAGGVLYAAVNIIGGAATGGDTLAIIDKATGLGTVVGAFGGGIGSDGGPHGIDTVAFDATGTLYGATGDHVLTTGTPSLYTIDPATGQATLVGPIVDGVGTPVEGGVGSLQFACDGTLYGGTGRRTGNLIQIDPATGVFTLIGNAFPDQALGGLAFQAGCGCRPVQSGGALGWTALTPMPAAHAGSAGVILGDRIYVTHGSSSTLPETADNIIYDIASDTWSAGTSATAPRAELAGVCVEDDTGQGLVFAAGGRDAAGPLASVETYHPILDSWSTLAAMPTARRGLGAAFVPDLGVAGGSLGSVFVLGGSDGTGTHTGSPLAVNEAYDVDLGVWAAQAPMPAAMMDIYSTAYFPGTGRIYVFGGYDGAAVSSLVQIYDPVADSWSLGQPMPTPRSNFVAGICGARIYAIGGFDGSDLGINESYDPFSDTWFAPEPAKPTAASRMAAQFLHTGAEIFALGGTTGGAATPAHERFTCGAAPSPCFVDADCDDGSVCNGTETCDVASGQCHAGTTLDCSDGNPCTADACDPVSGCSNPDEPDGTSCEDGNVCNGLETCQGAACTSGTPLDCVDGNECTADTCDPVSGCANDPLVTGTACGDPGDECTIQDTCDGAGTCADNGFVPADTSCGDGSDTECTDADTCDGAGACLANDEPAATSCGDASDTECTNPDSCDGAGACLANDEAPDTACGDTGDECIVQDTCDGAGVCTDNGWVAVDTACGDPSDTECTNPDTCDGAGACLINDETSGTVCGDPSDTECTNADTCDGAGACLVNDEPPGATCGDEGDDCTVQDVCDGAGACTDEGFVPVDTPCGDPSDNECTNADSCDGAGICLANDEPVGLACGDPSDTECTSPDSCDGAGACAANDELPGAACGDPSDTACTDPDSCDGAGACLVNDELAGFSCGDPSDSECTNPDSCDGLGACLDNDETSGTACGDAGDECTLQDACDGAGACTDNGFIAPGSACGDPSDTECANPDSCDGAGACLTNDEAPGAACGDPSDTECANPDSCDGAGICLTNDEVPGSACGDASDTECTNPDSCDGAGACLANDEAPGAACGDAGDECIVQDTCDGVGSCTDNAFHPAGSSCGDPADTDCTSPDTCDGDGVCLANDEPGGAVCGDPSDTECTNPDSCDGVGACLDNDETPGTTCGDPSDTECTHPDSCDGAGACLDNDEPATTACGDPSDTECTNPDMCDGGGACLVNDEPVGAACGDVGDECTVQDTCDGTGSCDDNGFFSAGTICGDPSDTACTHPDSCDGIGACLDNDEPPGTSCADGLFCNGDETCQSGACTAGAPVSCEDGNPCTADVCDEASTGCLNPPLPDSETAGGSDGQCNTGDDNLDLFGPDDACGSGDDGAGDGLCDVIDNCPLAHNPTQQDSDLDTAGDPCDATPCPATNVLSLADDAQGLPGSMVVPVNLSDVTGQGVMSADFTLEFNPAVLSATSAEAGTLTPGCLVTPNMTAPGIVVISVFCDSAFVGAGSLTEVTFDVLGSFDEGTPLHLTQGVLNEGIPEVCLDDGLFTVPGSGAISGRVLYYRDDVGGVEPGSTPVLGVGMSLSGNGPGVPDATVTDPSGDYLFTGKEFASDYTVTGDRSGGFGTEVISSYDAAQNAQAVVGILTLTPNQLLAADVSGNGAATSFDSALIARFAAGLITQFPVATALGSDWFLVPVPAPQPNQTMILPVPSAAVQGSVSLSPLIQPASGQDFLAGLFGDVSGNFQGSGMPSGEQEGADSRTRPRIGGTGARLRVSSATAAPGEIIQVSIDAQRAGEAIAFDLALRYDPSVLQPVDVRPGEAAARFTLTSNLGESGKVRFGLFDSASLGGSGSIAVIAFQVVGQHGDQVLLELEGTVDEGRIPSVSRAGRIRVRNNR